MFVVACCIQFLAEVEAATSELYLGMRSIRRVTTSFALAERRGGIVG